jgi:hypothetical protein
MSYQVRAHGAHHVGTSGPLLMVTTCEGVLAGALLHALAPRPVHVVANAAMDRALPDRVLNASGDIRISGPGAVLTQRRVLAALRDERAVVVAGADAPVGYLVGVAGVPVMPVVLLGAEGRVPTDPPRPRSRIDVFFAPPVTLQLPGDPLRAATRSAIAEQVRQLLADAEELASMRVVQ